MGKTDGAQLDELIDMQSRLAGIWKRFRAFSYSWMLNAEC